MKELFVSLFNVHLECLKRQLDRDSLLLDIDTCKACPYNLGEETLADIHDIHSQTCIFERMFSGEKPYLWVIEEPSGAKLNG